jgi:hypothetical protein
VLLKHGRQNAPARTRGNPLRPDCSCACTAGISAQPPAGPPSLAAAPVRRSRPAPAPLAFNLLARGLLPCTRTRLRNRAKPATGRTLPLAPVDAPVRFRPDLRVLQLRRPLHLLRRHEGRGPAAPGHLLCLTSPPPLARRGGDPCATTAGPRGRRFGRSYCLLAREGVLGAAAASGPSASMRTKAYPHRGAGRSGKEARGAVAARLHRRTRGRRPLGAAAACSGEGGPGRRRLRSSSALPVPRSTPAPPAPRPHTRA